MGSLSGLKSITSASSEGMSMVMLEYEYGTDTDEAYDDLKKKIDLVTTQLPNDADTPGNYGTEHGFSLRILLWPLTMRLRTICTAT